MFDFLKFFKKTQEDDSQKDALREILKNKYRSFQQLLSFNNQVLELMADMEEKYSGEYLFDMHYIKTNARLVGSRVLKMIEHLNDIARDKYREFYTIHDEIQQKVEKILENKMEIPVSDLTIPIENLTSKSLVIAGGKIAQLGEIKSTMNLPTPLGFVISSYAFVKFMDHNRLVQKIQDRLSSLGIDNLEELNKFSKEIYNLILESEVPPELQEAIDGAYKTLCKKMGKKVNVSVRSSAIREDSEFSFAGQYATFLNVQSDLIIRKYKEVVASLFTPRAIFYSKTKGFSEEEMVMSVGVLNMIDAEAGGVMYTRNPNKPDEDHLIINAVFGLGKAVVDGTITPDTYTVSRHPEGAILNKNITHQETMLVSAVGGDIAEVPVAAGKGEQQVLGDEHIKALSQYGLQLEGHYGAPQDIEWALDSDHKIYILQSRPLRTFAQQTSSMASIPTRMEGFNILLDKGAIACKGVGFGKVFILKDDEYLKDFPEGGILVAQHTNPKYVMVMNKAAGIITDIGSVTGHMGSLAREYQVPTILDTEVGTTVLKDGQEITLDAFNCNIYEGRVDELIEYAKKKKEPFKDTHLFKTLQKLLQWIVPLNLTDPQSKDFKIENCKTYHDITRYIHEVSMHEMFTIGATEELHETPSVPLSAGIPIAVQMLDLEGGIRENIKKATPEDILSIPFMAILKGMKSMKWPGPPPADAKGFLGMLAHTASVQEDQLYEMGKSSFAVVSADYMNFSIRLGYHFSMIEAYAGENMNDNYIKFFFKGGGAAHDRRLRRVRLISTILKEMGFRMSIKEDVIDAILTKYKREAIEKQLAILGKLTAYTKQLDMVMYNDAVTDMYIDQFVVENIRRKKPA